MHLYLTLHAPENEFAQVALAMCLIFVSIYIYILGTPGPYLSKLHSVDKKQWKIGIRQAYDRHSARENDSHLREKITNKQNFRSELEG